MEGNLTAPLRGVQYRSLRGRIFIEITKYTYWRQRLKMGRKSEEDTIRWNSAGEKLILPNNEVHLWSASVQENISYLNTYRHILSLEEKQRAERFKFKRDQDRFIIAHVLLRLVLSRYIKITPQAIAYSSNSFGKPNLKGCSDIETINFNMSHSNDHVLIAVANNLAVGVDIEWVRPIENANQIVETFFSAKEKVQFQSLSDHLKTEAFYSCWTRKEAFIKALGVGISLPLNQFSVSFLPGEPADLLEVPTTIEQPEFWTLEEFQVREGYVAAIAAQGTGLKFCYWKWT